MSDDEDITPLLQAKSDQLNADDLVGGPIDVRITGARLTGSAEQPLEVVIDGGHKPWKPCKSMMRLLTAFWGPHPGKWVGRRVRLYRDPSVKWGGAEVGGIRVSGLSHIDGPKNISLSVKKGVKAQHRVDVLRDTPAKAPSAPQETRKAESATDDAAEVEAARTTLLDLLRDEFGAAPSTFRQFIETTTGKPTADVRTWKLAQLQWAARKLGGDMAQAFREFIDEDGGLPE